MNITLLQDRFPELKKMIRELSLNRFSRITSLKKVDIREIDKADAFTYGAHQAVIQIASQDLTLTFKSHFNIRDVKSLIEKHNQDPVSSAQQKKATYDLFKEFSNLIAGGITEQLGKHGILCGISLPIATSGFDEIIYSDEVKSNRCYDYWSISGKNIEFSCTVNVEIFETERLQGYHFDEESIKVKQRKVMKFL